MFCFGSMLSTLKIEMQAGDLILHAIRVKCWMFFIYTAEAFCHGNDFTFNRPAICPIRVCSESPTVIYGVSFFFSPHIPVFCCIFENVGYV